MERVRIGVLALQGAFREHLAMLARMENGGSPAGSGPVEVVEVRLPEQLADLDGLIIPGGESTTIGKLLVDYALLEPLRERVAAGLPIFGTCAGMIVLANSAGANRQPLVGGLDVVVQRNAFGRQLQSFETDLAVPVLGEPALRAIFIRAPAIATASPEVQVLARLADGTIVAVRQGNLLATAFHPELTGDLRFHRYFYEMVVDRTQREQAD